MNKNIDTTLKVLFFEITKRCNAHCDHCGSRCDINEPDGISKELFMSVLDDVATNIGTDEVMLNITGGEPLIRKDLFEIMGHASSLGFNWGMVTNGTLISNDIITSMKKTKMRTISISIDGLKDTHETFRHLPNSFDNIIRNITKLQQANFLDCIQVTFIANKQNINELPALWRLLNNLHIDSLRISCIDPIGRANDNKHLLLEKDDFTYLFKFMNETNMKRELPIEWSCSHYFGNTNVVDDTKRHFKCNTGIHVASILANGDIFVCPNVPRIPSLIQGNITKDKFSTVWKEKFEFFRNRPLNEKCNHCPKKEYCNGDSLHTWDFENNKPQFCYQEMFQNDTKIETKKKNAFSYEDYKRFVKKRFNNPYCDVISSNTTNAKDIILEPQAYIDLKTYFHMGQKHPISMYEQLMALVGFKVEDNYIVKFAIPMPMNNRTRNMGYVDKSTLAYAKEELDIINENLPISDYKDDLQPHKLKLLGFAHSHPLDTEFGYSDGDIAFHNEMINKLNDYVAILINPDKDLIIGLYGKDYTQGNLHLITKNT